MLPLYDNWLISQVTNQIRRKMNYTFKDDSPIFQQLAKALEDDIFLGTYEEGTAIPSTTELSVALHINPATVLKAMNLLLDMDLIEKRRGIGMFVKN